MTRFTRQDGVEEQWRIIQPLLDAPPPVQPMIGATARVILAQRLAELA
ncbi:MAG: Glucose-6-phosphate dehydrogenase, C-terminal domain [Micromonosporaceae bacterium]|jgi:glucose-6-phosphate 1-dehydrogenase|nr:Glucose-6-phosphate dehydrogenase, C-terminal domain [Micromonosporaceae bacterium]